MEDKYYKDFLKKNANDLKEKMKKITILGIEMDFLDNDMLIFASYLIGQDEVRKEHNRERGMLNLFKFKT